MVGLGCRYPGGVQDPESFWRLLREEQDAICEVPLERWDVKAYYDPQPDAPGKISTRFGGFLDRIDQFDPYFFGIAPREASSMDPQQRLLLEIAWEALEHAGLAADRLRGSRTGVFVGISGSEYAHRLLNAPPETINSYLGSGNASSVAAGRLSYVFGFEGPSLAIDTACSSSLVSVHLACQSSAARRMRSRAGGRRECHPDAHHQYQPLARPHAGGGWPLQDLRRERRWVRAVGGLRVGGPQALVRRARRRRLDPG